MTEFTQGRMRLSNDSADEVLEALEKHKEDLLDGRSTVVGVGPEAVGRFNRRLKQVQRALDELMRLYTEQGWNHGEHQ